MYGTYILGIVYTQFIYNNNWNITLRIYYFEASCVLFRVIPNKFALTFTWSSFNNPHLLQSNVINKYTGLAEGKIVFVQSSFNLKKRLHMKQVRRVVQRMVFCISSVTCNDVCYYILVFIFHREHERQTQNNCGILI